MYSEIFRVKCADVCNLLQHASKIRWNDREKNGWICGKTSIIDVNGTTCLLFPYVHVLL